MSMLNSNFPTGFYLSNLAHATIEQENVWRSVRFRVVCIDAVPMSLVWKLPSPGFALSSRFPVLSVLLPYEFQLVAGSFLLLLRVVFSSWGRYFVYLLTQRYQYTLTHMFQSGNKLTISCFFAALSWTRGRIFTHSGVPIYSKAPFLLENCDRFGCIFPITNLLEGLNTWRLIPNDRQTHMKVWCPWAKCNFGRHFELIYQTQLIYEILLQLKI